MAMQDQRTRRVAAPLHVLDAERAKAIHRIDKRQQHAQRHGPEEQARKLEQNGVESQHQVGSEVEED